MLERLTRDAAKTAMAVLALLAIAAAVGTAVARSAALSSAIFVSAIGLAMLLAAMHSTGGWSGRITHR